MTHIKLCPSMNKESAITCNYSAFLKRVADLKERLFPLTRASRDKEGNVFQIWSLPKCLPVAVLQRPDGSIRYFTHIHNPLQQEEDAVTLHNRLLCAPDCQWDYAVKADGSLMLWPHLAAEGWRQAIYKALFDLQPKVDYIIKPIQDEKDKYNGTKLQIMILDKQNTGRLQPGCRWEHGLHEFLEAKHGLAVQQESVTAASLCHPVFFSRYKHIYGMSGTLGTQTERAEIEQIYGVDSFDIPPHRTILRKTHEIKVVESTETYYMEILVDIRIMISQKRPILIILESIQETENLANVLDSNYIVYQMLNEIQVEKEEFVIAKAGLPGQVTIATNTAGRGTDIILHHTSLKNGGMHVIFGFDPVNERVKNQGFGRCGRQGQPGSARIILNVKSLFKNDTNLPNNSIRFSANLLDTFRHVKIEQESHERLRRTNIERIKYSYLENFFNRLQSEKHSSFTKEAKAKMIQNWAEQFYSLLDDCYLEIDNENPGLGWSDKANLFRKKAEELFQTVELSL